MDSIYLDRVTKWVNIHNQVKFYQAQVIVGMRTRLLKRKFKRNMEAEKYGQRIVARLRRGQNEN